ncbi:unnamed protein product [Owenia fusiformis]|uniref:Glycosyltransferase family 92 protein n=1 Tax=Owenia fusiformis TaxID=6347 RepID=A0A8J1TM05_OWEFU|nr:unnamed protein product [Owenia fusiformis]
MTIWNSLYYWITMRFRRSRLLQVSLMIAVLLIFKTLNLYGQEKSKGLDMFRQIPTENNYDRGIEIKANVIESQEADEDRDVFEGDGIKTNQGGKKSIRVAPDVIHPIENSLPPDTHHHNILEERGKAKWPERLNWVKIKGDITVYLLAAFYDDRDTLKDHFREAAVRVIAISESKHVEMMCHLHYDDRVVKVKADVVRTSVLRRFVFENKQFRSNIYSCKVIKQQNSNKSPKFVSIVGPWQKSPTTFLPIETPGYRKPLYKFCGCQRHFGNLDPSLIVENFEIQKMFGISKMFIYTTELDRIPAAVLEHYMKEGFVEVIEVPAMFENYPPNHYRPNHIRILQPPSYNHCIYRNLYKCEFMIINDPDEFIVPRRDQDYTTMLKNIDRNHNISEGYKTSYVFRNAFFYTHLPQNETEPSYVKSLRHQARMKARYPDDSVKSFLRPSSCIGYHVHFCWTQTHESKGRVIVNTDFALNYHYRACHKIWEKTKKGNRCEQFKNEYQIDTHMLRYKDRIISAMRDQAQKIGLPLS